MATIQLKIGGMTCQGCVRSVTKKLGSVPGVRSVDVSLDSGRASVECDESAGTRALAGALVEAARQIGFSAEQSDL